MRVKKIFEKYYKHDRIKSSLAGVVFSSKNTVINIYACLYMFIKDHYDNRSVYEKYKICSSDISMEP